MKSAITVSLVPEARQGPFVFHESLHHAAEQAAELGFNAIEVFPPSGSALAGSDLESILATMGLELAAVGTGAGWLVSQLSLTSTDSVRRQLAIEFIKEIIAVAGKFSAPAIIGSMQGKFDPAQGRTEALNVLGDALAELSEFAHREFETTLLIEPLNRYESNVLNRIDETSDWLDQLGLKTVRVLADFFHMNIEEPSMSESIRRAEDRVGHVHFADSNRSAVGFGHSPIKESIQALRDIGYGGYLSAEILPRPDSITAASQTIQSFRQLTSPGTPTC